MSNIVDVQALNLRIKTAWDEINNILSQANNSLLVFEFAFFLHSDKEKTEVQSYTYGDVRYYDILFPFLEKNGFAYTYRDITRVTSNLKNITKPLKVDFIAYNKVAKRNLIVEKGLSQWDDYLNDIEYGGCNMTLYYQVKDDIDIGVFILLTNPLDGYNNLFPEKSTLRAKYDEAMIYQIVNDFLIIIGQEVGLNELKRTKMLDELENRLSAYRHTIFNKIPKGRLKYIETELIKLNSTLKNSKEKPKNKDILHTASSLTQKMKNALKAVELLSIFLHVTFKTEKQNKIEDISIFDMLQIFKKLSPTDDPNPSPIIIVKNLSKDFIITGDNSHKAFTTLWNLWDNARKNSFGFCPEITLDEVNDCLQLRILTGQIMDEDSVKRYNDKLINKAPNRGIDIIKLYAFELGWDIQLIETGYEKTDFGYCLITINTPKMKKLDI